ncbi:MAG: hypothetical protein A2039_08670 [Candidatus Melainabacteria bacterium GWA2_34_9]|nr:MAG: hypothetical protein A2039_08670 [Candidatus Melainabacteria bacterium GWA2_34_9]
MLIITKNAIGRTKTQECIPQKSALIVIDMQKYFCDESSHAFIPSSPAIIPKIKLLVDNYKEKNLPVIFTQHTNTPENAGMMNKWWGDVISDTSQINEIIPEFNVKEAYLIKKSQYDAFYNTDLEDYLRKNNISQLVITGVMTHLCCETTARTAFTRGFETFLCIDSTATYNESFHTAAMLNLAHGFSELTLSGEICRKLHHESQ